MDQAKAVARVTIIIGIHVLVVVERFLACAPLWCLPTAVAAERRIVRQWGRECCSVHLLMGNGGIDGATVDVSVCFSVLIGVSGLVRRVAGVLPPPTPIAKASDAWRAPCSF